MNKIALRSFLLVVLLSVISLIGCAFLQDEKMEFSHKNHIDRGLSCNGCHVTATKGSKAGMPAEGKCALCHPTVYDDKPVEEIYTLNEWSSTRGVELAVFDEVKFSHKKHIDNGKKCSDCHGSVDKSMRITAEHTPDANTCVLCHSNWLNQKLCGKCHFKTRMEAPPDDHKRSDFMSSHGKILKDKPFNNWIEGTGRHSGLCFQCHNQDHCVKCHEEMEPRDHTNQWRSIGHGISAGINRDRCNSCHKTDFCVRCHEETRPRSHVANWGATRSRHCAYCHEPLNSNNCIVCHKDTLSHDDAPNAPLFVRQGWPCRLCHLTIVPLDHYDNGEDCEHCHRVLLPPVDSFKSGRRFKR